MTPEQKQCPDSEVLAAFVAGNLIGAERKATVAHTCSCRDCLSVIADAGKAERGEVFELQIEAQPTPSALRRRPRSWRIIGIAAILAGIGFANVWVLSKRNGDPLQPIVAAVSSTQRNVEPRLAGFPWTPLADGQRGDAAGEPNSMKLVGAAGTVLERTQNDPSDEGQHAAALAHLIAARTSEAITRLEKLTVTTNEARIWSDYAAVLYTDAQERGGDPARLARALSAVDKALALDARFAEALFNRALILEHLGFDVEAREAWERYLSADGEDGWKREAHQHLSRLAHARLNGNRASATDFLPPARDAVLRGRWTDALGLLALELKCTANDEAANVLLHRASIYLKLGTPRLAASDVARARVIIDGTNDPVLRWRVTSASLQLESSLMTDPSSVVKLLDGTIESLAPATPRGYSLAALYLERGRAFGALGNYRRAFEDLESGLHQAPLDAWNTPIQRAELLDEAVRLALATGNARRAFGYVEDARGGSTDAASMRDRGTILIEYKMLPERLVIFVMTGDTVTATQTVLRGETLEAEVNELATRATVGDTARFRKSAALLYTRLIAPVATRLTRGHTLIIVPDASLRDVPFAALLSPTNRYLIQDHAITVTPNATTYARLSKRSRDKARTALVAAGPSRNDAAGRLFRAQMEARVIAGEYARAEQTTLDVVDFFTLARDADIIHIAAHAVMADPQPALIMLAPSGEPEPLDASRIATMDLHRTELVVLSACDSARRGQNGTQQSLADAFLEAGASSVIGTLWPIDDASAGRFFPRIHAHVAQGASAADALRAAQLESIRAGDLPPATWAAAIVIGRG